MKEAMLYEALDDGRVRCRLCAHRCVIRDGERGTCHVRQNRGGTLHTLVYGRTISQHVDPVEKKPLAHFYPGTSAYSIATVGCNFHCEWCQNASISQMPRERNTIIGDRASPEQIVAAARRSGCQSIAYTYTEPTVFFEYVFDTARLAREEGIANLIVTNGFMTSGPGEMLETFDPYLDAANVDLKAFRDETYRRLVGGRLQPVLDSLVKMKQLGVWVEVTTLVVPGINDDEAEMRDAARFVSRELGSETPWHISRFYPGYRMTQVPPTPVETLQRAREIGAEEGLRYIFVGNVPGEANTECHVCGELLIRRVGYHILSNRVEPGDLCPNCGTPVAGVGLAPEQSTAEGHSW
ncbi:MAG: AmmeMemoRadiSam system radical SAM enzyme [Anaerolineae bacterium]|jgi:pyruvate formate lyase activating enzyme